MNNLTLVVMAAGMGSRYGGLKQIDPIGPSGEIVIDYSVYDALRAGFDRVVFVIRHDLEEAFREKVGRTIEKKADTEYVFQQLEDLPEGFSVPADRKKPWGTGHAVLTCRKVVKTPFAVINADDFYGAGAYQVLADYLRQAQDRPGAYDYSMVAYILRNTLSAYGSVARGICSLTAEGNLATVKELTKIVPDGSEAKYTENGVDWNPLSGDSLASMNMFGFTPSFLTELESHFELFLRNQRDRLDKAEYFLPTVVNQLIEEKKAQVRVLKTGEKWFGMTNPDDRPTVQQAIAGLVTAGKYPTSLWS